MSYEPHPDELVLQARELCEAIFMAAASLDTFQAGAIQAVADVAKQKLQQALDMMDAERHERKGA